MSLKPLPKIICGPVRRNYPIDPVGTAHIVHGHRLKERKCTLIKHPPTWGTIFEDSGRERDDDIRTLEQSIKTMEFEKETNRKIRRKNMRRKVEEGMAAYEESVNERREKLRDLILKEEMALTREVVDQAQHGDDTRMDDLREKTERLKEEEEEQRLAIVAAKRMQQYLRRCPDVRQKISKRITVDAKCANLEQIADNDARREAEKRLDALWHEITMKEMEVKRLRETEDRNRQAKADKEMTIGLTQQILWKLAEEEEAKRQKKIEQEKLECLWKQVREEEQKRLEMEKKKREALKKELEDQILITQRFLAERARQEKAVERMLNIMAEEEIAKEKSDIRETSAALRKEMLAYLEYLEQLREEEARRELEVEAVLEQSMKDEQARRHLALTKFREARARGLREMLRGRDEQMKMIREAQERERQLREEEKIRLEEELEFDAKLTEEERRERKERAISYARDLKEQVKYMQVKRHREVEENEQIYKDGLKREEEYHRLTDELVDASEDITPHPFKVVLKQYIARLDAEKRGQIYCPPPL